MPVKNPPRQSKYPWRVVPPGAELVTLALPFAEEEIAAIEARAAAAEMSVDDYVLTCVLNAAGTT